MTQPDELERVRVQLRELGYLSHRVDRLLLQDALRPAEAWQATPRLAIRIGILAGLPVGAVAALALGLSNRLLEHDPLGILPLWLHLAVPSCVVAIAAFFGLAALELLLLGRSKTARIDRVSGALTAVGGIGAAVLLVAIMRRSTFEVQSGALVVLAVVAGLAGYAALALLRGGLLALAVARTGRAPGLRRARSWGVAFGAVLAAALVVTPAILASRTPPKPKVDQLPMGPGVPVALIGIDGVLPDELDYLLDSGRLPALAAIAETRWSYARPDGPPASLWTTVATGVAPEVHEVRAVDGFRPRGVGFPLVVPTLLRRWWEATMVPLGLVEHRPSLSSRRDAAFVWEVAARGGRPVVVGGWWSTYPAAPVAGALVAHGAAQLLDAGTTAGVASDPAVLSDLQDLVRAVQGDELPAVLRGLDSDSETGQWARRAIEPDALVLGAVERFLPEFPGAGVVAAYVAAPDLLAADGLASSSPLVFADLVGHTLERVDALLAALDPAMAVAVVVDPGRRAARSGVVLFRPRRAGCDAGGALDIAAVAAMLGREAGLPDNREGVALPPCRWPAPAASVTSWGAPPASADAAGGEGAAEYLESLRSLGYIGG